MIGIIIDFLDITGAKHIKGKKADILSAHDAGLNQELGIEIELARIFFLFPCGLKASM